MRSARPTSSTSSAWPPRRVVWGHSQGGHAALWAGILAPAHAPAVNVIGVAALAPASDLTSLVEDLVRVPGGSIFAAYAITAYSQTCKEVQFGRYVRPAAQLLSRQEAPEQRQATSNPTAGCPRVSAGCGSRSEGKGLRGLMTGVPDHHGFSG